MTELRPIRALSIAGITPATLAEASPVLEWVDPRSLFVEESYQRNLSEKSITLIRRIVREWSWNRTKPVICARDEEGRLVVIDGQHTAIAAVSHGGIQLIPALIVPAADLASRAGAFVGHNLDRIALTPMQMYFAAVTAGDQVALIMQAACEQTGARIRRSQPASGIWKRGETVAVNALRHVAENKGRAGCVRVLNILVDAHRAPIRYDEIKAVAWLIFDRKELIRDFDLATVIRSKSADNWHASAAAFAERQEVTLIRGLAECWREALPAAAVTS